MKRYIVYECKICSNNFILLRKQIKYSEEESRYITCPFHGRHKDIIVVGAYDSIQECMEHRTYRRKRRRLQQVRK